MKSFTFVAAALASVSSVSAATFNVAVGAGGAIAYTPNTVNASVGDTINFQFMSRNHTVTQSSFADPCTQLTTPSLGIDSGFMPVAANATQIPQFSITINNASAPLWFYCKQTGHCAQGMVFAINPTAAKNFTAFQAAANATGSSSGSSGSSSTTSSGSSTTTPAPSGSGVSGASTTTTSPNGALNVALNSGGLLTAIGLAAGLLL